MSFEFETCPVPLWHGTTLELLGQIADSGLGRQDIIAQIGAINFLGEVVEALGITYDGIAQGQFDDIPTSIYAYNAANQTTKMMHWRHGQAYVTTSKSHAVSFATRAPEILTICEELLQDCRDLGRPEAEEALEQYPELRRALQQKRTPVLLRIDAAPMTSLKSHDGGSLTAKDRDSLLSAASIAPRTILNFVFEISIGPTQGRMRAWKVGATQSDEIELDLATRTPVLENQSR